MTRKDYILIAKYLRYGADELAHKQVSEDTANGYDHAIQQLIGALAEDNRNFSPTKFLSFIVN